MGGLYEPSFRGRTVLVIEDNDEHREVIGRLLEAIGARVVVASDGLEGLAQLERERPDAILCDLTMPIMDGHEFARLMRESPRHRRVLLIAVTGRDGPRDVLETWQSGFDAHLVKPVDTQTLRAIARRLSHLNGEKAEAGA